MKIYVQPSGRAQAKVLAALQELNLTDTELVFMDGPKAKEKYPDLNIVDCITIPNSSGSEWAMNLKIALEKADAVLFFLSPNRNNIRTCKIYRSFLAKDKLMWIYDTKEGTLVNDVLKAEKAEKYVRTTAFKFDTLSRKILGVIPPHHNNPIQRAQDPDMRTEAERDADTMRLASILEMLETTVKDIQNAKLGIKKLEEVE